MALSAPASDVSDAPDRRARMRILVVEATEIVARECVSTLRKVERLEPKVVKGEIAALEELQAWRPQLVIVGDDLAGQCGLQVCEKIRRRSMVPLILITAWPDTTHQIHCLNSGADDCLAYPFEPPMLLARVLCLMRRAYRYSLAPDGASLSTGPKSPPSQSAQWPKCESCGYVGPREKFEKNNGGRATQQCPACGERSRILHPMN